MWIVSYRYLRSETPACVDVTECLPPATLTRTLFIILLLFIYYLLLYLFWGIIDTIQYNTILIILM